MESNNAVHEAKSVVDNIFNIEKNEQNNCHYEWLIREVMKVLNEKCKIAEERSNRIRK